MKKKSPLSLTIDFTPIFDWNTKQIFVTVAAEYQTHHYVRVPMISPPLSSFLK
jgi:hypothetical protein